MHGAHLAGTKTHAWICLVKIITHPSSLQGLSHKTRYGMWCCGGVLHRTPSLQLCGVCTLAQIKKLRCNDKAVLMPQYLCYQPTMWKLNMQKLWLTYPYTGMHWPAPVGKGKRRQATTNVNGGRSDGARPKLGSAMYRMLRAQRESGHWKIYAVGIMMRMAPRKALPGTAPQRTPPLLAGPVHPWHLQGTTAAAGRP